MTYTASDAEALDYGFALPAGTDLIRGGDETIKQNAKAAAGGLRATLNRLEVNEKTLDDLAATATTLEYGQPATVTVTGTRPAKVIHIGIPEGMPDSVGAQLVADSQTAATTAQQVVDDYGNLVTLAQQAQAAAYEIPDNAIRDIASNPSTATSAFLSSTYALKSETGDASLFVYHDRDAAYPRPSTPSAVVWMGSVQPTGMLDGDVYLVSEAPPAPDEPVITWLVDLTADNLALTEGALVTEWTDASGNGHSPFHATVARQPVFRAATESTPAYVEFDGVDDNLRTGTLSLTAQPWTLAIVFRQRSITTGTTKKPFFYTKAGSLAAFQQAASGGVPNYQAYAGTFGATSGMVPTAGEWHVAVITFDGAATTVRVDGAQETLSVGTNSFNGLYLCSDSAEGQNSDSDLSIVRVAASALDGGAVADFEAWAAYHHNITLAG